VLALLRNLLRRNWCCGAEMIAKCEKAIKSVAAGLKGFFEIDINVGPEIPFELQFISLVITSGLAEVGRHRDNRVHFAERKLEFILTALENLVGECRAQLWYGKNSRCDNGEFVEKKLAVGDSLVVWPAQFHRIIPITNYAAKITFVLRPQRMDYSLIYNDVSPQVVYFMKAFSPLVLSWPCTHGLCSYIFCCDFRVR